MKRILIMTALLAGIAQADQQKGVAQLKAYISIADVALFKSAYATAEATPENKTQLLEFAHSTKQKLTAELESWGKSTINKKKLALGALQALGVAYCLAQIGYVAYGAIMPLTLYKNDYFISIPEHMDRSSTFITCPSILIYLLSHMASRIWFGNGKYATATVAPALCVLSAYGAYRAFNASTKNFKQGINYPAHLAQQIQNLDEIIAYLQNPTIVPAIEEQV